jgi:hypothetical protein
MSTATELLRRALDRIDWVYPSDIALKDEIRAFLATEPEAEPVAYQWLHSGHFRKQIPKNANVIEWYPLYLHPPRPEPEAEPFAYALESFPKGSPDFLGFACDKDIKEEVEQYVSDQIVPLYTRPEPARKPMTEEEAIELCPFTREEFKAGFLTGIRFAEKHHGISGEDQ